MSSHPVDVRGYLRRLGFDATPSPTLDALRALHAAHVEQIAYETLEIHLDRPPAIDPEGCVDRIVRTGRGGYCYHLNGAFAALLDALGYDVRRHRASVRPESTPHLPIDRNHLALTVHGLDGATWLVDVGLGDALHTPIPLTEGRHRQGIYTLGLRRSAVERDAWRLDHDPSGSFDGVDITTGPATTADFADRHRELSTSPSSGFVRVATVQRRCEHAVDVVRGLVVEHTDEQGATARRLETAEEWFRTVTRVFGIVIDEPDRDPLWTRMVAADRRWRDA